jgi:hypothetical protein
MNQRETDANFQRVGSKSNTQVGKDFEKLARKTLSAHGIETVPDVRAEVGITSPKKQAVYDLGKADGSLLVEVKSYTWTSGNNVPVAKINGLFKVVSEFATLGPEVRKILFAKRDPRPTNGETLIEYFIRTHGYMIAPDIEFWELDEETGEVTIIRNEVAI